MATFPHTPGYPFATTRTFAVAAVRFDDASEQRWLASQQGGLALRYDFTHPDSSLTTQVASWFLDNVGPGQYFTVLDHRTGSSHLVRFASNQFGVTRVAPRQFQMATEFSLVTSGVTTPIATAFSRPAAPLCQVGTPTIVDTPWLNPNPEILVTQGDSGADWNFWRTTSIAGFTGYYATNAGFGQVNATFDWFTNKNILFAMPFISPRSGAVIGEIGFFVEAAGPAGAEARAGLYVQTSKNMDLYPGSLVLDFGYIPLTALGYATVTTSAQLVADVMYYCAAVASLGSTTIRCVEQGIAGARGGGWRIGLPVGDLGEGWSWASSRAPGAMPTTHPTNTAALDNRGPMFFVRFVGSG